MTRHLIRLFIRYSIPLLHPAICLSACSSRCPWVFLSFYASVDPLNHLSVCLCFSTSLCTSLCIFQPLLIYVFVLFRTCVRQSFCPFVPMSVHYRFYSAILGSLLVGWLSVGHRDRRWSRMRACLARGLGRLTCPRGFTQHVRLLTVS